MGFHQVDSSSCSFLCFVFFHVSCFHFFSCVSLLTLTLSSLSLVFYVYTLIVRYILSIDHLYV
ncbi:hypothetical protein DFP72DRAFT_506609 [Ephemerocybe angulata]|uniref:Uncharacterized protein n=1 Tax=Ephemerocybe angulata TaxID=980116 RepID=A0A8H6HS99_9AGAR|nr:hypothetical protein DFP72DRAFT_506609 [Tulosesus angulatus]